ncbi:SsrA-binding protein SmpB [Patescibacteria group bacterium]|nr:SsrA-binding protein SmpB [Patescibacteria group bacterium]
MTEITTNKRLLHDYQILEKYEAGIKFSGSEVKTVKKGQIDIKGSYITLKTNVKTHRLEAWLIGTRIPKYAKSGYSQNNYNPSKNRKLLLNQAELKTLTGKAQQKGLTLLPLSVYTTPHRLIKLTLILAKGKKKADKRELLKKREFTRRKQRLQHH